MECKVCVDGMCQNLNIWCVLDEEVSEEGVGAIRSLVNTRGFHESLVVPILMCDSEMIWKERSTIRVVQMGNLRFARY